jgi:5-methyltetrahydrofolate--homocysteine methyltransferase
VKETVWFDPPDNKDIQDIHPAYDANNIWWQRVLDLTRTAVRRFGKTVSISHTDLGGNLDIVASLRGTEQLLYDLYDAPDEVERVVNEVTQLWLRYYRELEPIIAQAGRGTTPWAPIWSAKRCYMLQCDFSYMISPAMFERFVMPDLAACCDYLDHGFYHLDGKGQIPHLDMLLSLKRLRGIQWIPGAGAPPPHRWLPLLKRIKDAGKLCQIYLTPFGARRIVRALGGRGFVLNINQRMTAPEASDFLKVLASEDCGQ